jgi:hypothetical protein
VWARARRDYFVTQREADKIRDVAADSKEEPIEGKEYAPSSFGAFSEQHDYPVLSEAIEGASIWAGFSFAGQNIMSKRWGHAAASERLLEVLSAALLNCF